MKSGTAGSAIATRNVRFYNGITLGGASDLNGQIVFESRVDSPMIIMTETGHTGSIGVNVGSRVLSATFTGHDNIIFNNDQKVPIYAKDININMLTPLKVVSLSQMDGGGSGFLTIQSKDTSVVLNDFSRAGEFIMASTGGIIEVEDGVDVVGSIKTTTDNENELNFAESGRVLGNVGTESEKLKAMNVNGDSAGRVTADLYTYEVNLGAFATGKNTNAFIEGKATICGNVNNINPAGGVAGQLFLYGGGQVDGDVGSAANPISLIRASRVGPGPITTHKGNVFATVYENFTGTTNFESDITITNFIRFGGVTIGAVNVSDNVTINGGVSFAGSTTVANYGDPTPALNLGDSAEVTGNIIVGNDNSGIINVSGKATFGGNIGSAGKQIHILRSTAPGNFEINSGTTADSFNLTIGGTTTKDVYAHNIAMSNPASDATLLAGATLNTDLHFEAAGTATDDVTLIIEDGATIDAKVLNSSGVDKQGVIQFDGVPTIAANAQFGAASPGMLKSLVHNFKGNLDITKGAVSDIAVDGADMFVDDFTITNTDAVATFKASDTTATNVNLTQNGTVIIEEGAVVNGDITNTSGSSGIGNVEFKGNPSASGSGVIGGGDNALNTAIFSEANANVDLTEGSATNVAANGRDIGAKNLALADASSTVTYKASDAINANLEFLADGKAIIEDKAIVQGNITNGSGTDKVGSVEFLGTDLSKSVTGMIGGASPNMLKEIILSGFGVTKTLAVMNAEKLVINSEYPSSYVELTSSFPGNICFGMDGLLLITSGATIGGNVINNTGSSPSGILRFEDDIAGVVTGAIGGSGAELRSVELLNAAAVTMENNGAGATVINGVDAFISDLELGNADIVATVPAGKTMSTAVNFTQDAVIVVGDGATIGDVTNGSGTDAQGTIEFLGDPTIFSTATIGSASPEMLKTVIYSATSGAALDLLPTAKYSTNVEINSTTAEAQYNLNGDYTGNVTFTKDGDITLADGAVLTGSLINGTGTDMQGTLTFAGEGVITGNAGVPGASLKTLSATGPGNVDVQGGLAVDTVSVDDSGAIVNIGPNSDVGTITGTASPAGQVVVNGPTKSGNISGVDVVLGGPDAALILADGATLDTVITAAVAGEGDVCFEGNATIDQDITDINAIKFPDDGTKTVTLNAANFNVDEVLFNEAPVIFVNPTTIDADVCLEDAHLDLGSNTLNVNNGNLQFKGTGNQLSFNLPSGATSPIELGPNSTIEFTPESALLLNFSDAASNTGDEHTIIFSGGALNNNSVTSPTINIANPTQYQWLVDFDTATGTVKIMAGELTPTTATLAAASAAMLQAEEETDRTLLSQSNHGRDLTLAADSLAGSNNTFVQGVSSGGCDKDYYGAWVAGHLGQVKQGVHKNDPGYTSNKSAVTVGLDFKLNDVMTAGGAFTFVDNDIKHQDEKIGDRTNINSYMLSLYTLHNITDKVFVDVAATVGIHKITNKDLRRAQIGGALEVGKGEYNALSMGAGTSVGYKYTTKLGALVPTIGARYSYVGATYYTETGSADNRLVTAKGVSKFVGSLGLKYAAPTVSLSDSFNLFPELNASVDRDFTGKKVSQTVESRRFNRLEVNARTPIRTEYTFGADLKAEHGMMEYGVSYDYKTAKKRQTHQGSLTVRVNF